MVPSTLSFMIKFYAVRLSNASRLQYPDPHRRALQSQLPLATVISPEEHLTKTDPRQ